MPMFHLGELYLQRGATLKSSSPVLYGAVPSWRADRKPTLELENKIFHDLSV